MKRKHIRMIVDVAMTILLPMLMAYSLIGEKFHEIAGTLMLILFILHHILNRKWYTSISKGKYNAGRIFRTMLDVILIAIMILQPVSGILMSKHLYIFIKLQGVSAAAREVHMCLAYWGFALMCIHAGTHLTAPASRLRRERKVIYTGIHAAWLAASAYGCMAFARRGLADYMLRRTAFAFFDYSEPKLYFFIDYAAMMLLFMFVGYVAVSALSKDNSRG